MAHNTTPFLLNLNSAEVDEPRISNDEFLGSLDTIGVWLRVLPAFDSLERYSSPGSTTAQRLAALSNIYLQLGAQLEDQAISLVAFSVWARNRDLAIADLFSRIFITRPGATKAGPAIETAHVNLLADSKTVRVDQRAFFQEVAAMRDAEIVEFFLGYKWRAVPSARLMPKKHIEVWRRLPSELRRIASSYYDERHIPRLTAAYNKLKHGPQLAIQNPVDRARRFGKSPGLAAQLDRHRSLDKASVRLLFAGARTQPASSEGKLAPVAPFLIDDAGAVNKIFFETMFHQANLFSVLVKMQIALYQKSAIDLDVLDEGISRITLAHGRYLAVNHLS